MAPAPALGLVSDVCLVPNKVCGVEHQSGTGGILCPRLLLGRPLPLSPSEERRTPITSEGSLAFSGVNNTPRPCFLIQMSEPMGARQVWPRSHP